MKPALRDGEGHALDEGALQLPTRHDLAVLDADEPEILSVDSAQLVQFEPVAARAAGLEFLIRPFFWDACDVLVVGQELRWAPLRAWFLTHFRPDEEGVDGFGLGLVHFMSDPEESRLSVDFGSASIDAFYGLIEAIAAAGGTQVTFGR